MPRESKADRGPSVPGKGADASFPGQHRCQEPAWEVRSELAGQEAAESPRCLQDTRYIIPRFLALAAKPSVAKKLTQG